ncbi:MAG: hypothetical protein ACKOWH_03730 [Rhodoluna sp.]
MRTPLRSILISLVALVAIGGAVSALTSGESSSPISKLGSTSGACVDNGVTLVVDFGTGSNKEPIETCAKNFSGTGWQLFGSTGVSVQGTSEFPESFVCRIQGWPESNLQDCADTPKYSEGTWAFYFADVETGSKWLISGVGASMQKPECGSVEGWLFIAPGENRDTAEPSVAPHPISCK